MVFLLLSPPLSGCQDVGGGVAWVATPATSSHCTLPKVVPYAIKYAVKYNAVKYTVKYAVKYVMKCAMKYAMKYAINYAVKYAVESSSMGLHSSN